MANERERPKADTGPGDGAPSSAGKDSTLVDATVPPIPHRILGPEHAPSTTTSIPIAPSTSGSLSSQASLSLSSQASLSLSPSTSLSISPSASAATIPPGALPPESMRLPDGALHVAGQRFEDGAIAWVTDPWTGDRVAPVVQADAAQAARAAEAAKDAFEATRRMASFARRRLLKEITRRITVAREELANLIVRESGKPKTLARFEVDRAIVTFGLGAEEAVRIGGEVVPLDVTESTAPYRGHWQRVPRGPVLAITPFNFPLNLVAHKVAPALACGAPVVLKPAPQTPLTALKLAEIVRESGAPPDTLQVVPCANEVAETLVRSDAFAVLTFTGSDEVGWHLKAIAGKKHVVLELGGNAACIVHEDAPNAAQLAALLCASAFNYAGQVCIKTQRLYVHRAIADRLLADLVPRTCAYEPQDPKSTTAAIGPMIDERAAMRVERWIDEARAAGAHPLAFGKRSQNRLPAALLRVDGDGRGLAIVEEEAFGPVLTVHVYDAFEDALRMAGATRYGLQVGVFTDSLSRVREAFDRLDVGAIVVNDVPSVRVDAMPYGGRRDSGIGREGVRYAIEEMTDRKLLVMRG
ncbi:MAG: aldehyde dehydrogenase family protein [Labilithrix sp.]|nr:aldehyde dehydrogenase family protein [Labilithrix sp.]